MRSCPFCGLELKFPNNSLNQMYHHIYEAHVPNRAGQYGWGRCWCGETFCYSWNFIDHWKKAGGLEVHLLALGLGVPQQ